MSPFKETYIIFGDIMSPNVTTFGPSSQPPPMFIFSTLRSLPCLGSHGTMVYLQGV